MLHNRETRGLNVGDKVTIVGNWIQGAKAGVIFEYKGMIEQGDDDPQGHPVPEDMMWFESEETGKVCPVPVGYIFGFPCEADLSFEKVTVN